MLAIWFIAPGQDVAPPAHQRVNGNFADHSDDAGTAPGGHTARRTPPRAIGVIGEIRAGRRSERRRRRPNVVAPEHVAHCGLTFHSRTGCQILYDLAFADTAPVGHQERVTPPGTIREVRQIRVS
ncbi:MAG TPA: hypothetical protein VG432_08295 [Gemmatimonadaceae bacterium]|nr:hypothetical protein [Gemmatimonadaceae bacterium]